MAEISRDTFAAARTYLACLNAFLVFAQSQWLGMIPD